jgi:hypothetical protein
MAAAATNATVPKSALADVSHTSPRTHTERGRAAGGEPAVSHSFVVRTLAMWGS